MARPSYIFRPIHPLGECAAGRFLAVDDQHGSAVWPVPLASPTCLGANEGTDLRGTCLLGCWS